MMSEQRADSALKAKKAAGRAAAALVEDGMVIGLGTGSTAKEFIAALAERCHKGLAIKAVATSIRSERQAYEAGIPIVDIDTLTSLDLGFDGADEIDPSKRMIKGGGGALLREKIVASMCREMIVMIDESKRVEKLGAFPLPVELLPFAYRATIAHIERLGFSGAVRNVSHDGKYVTDNGNYIYDLRLPPTVSYEEIHRTLIGIPGVIETGFFSGLAGRVIVGKSDGTVEILP